MNKFDVRLRLFTPDGARGRVLPGTFSFVSQNAAAASISLTVSEKVAGRLEAPFVVGIEYTTGDRVWRSPRNDLFIMTEDSSDGADATETVTFKGEGYVAWLLKMTYLHWSGNAINGERQWIQYPWWENGGSASPGYLLHGMLSESKARGWGAQISWDFTGSKDSLGADWSTAGEDLWWAPWKLQTPVSQVLSALVSGGYCEWWAEGTALKMVRPGTADTHPHVKLGGPGYTAIPHRSDFNGTYTHLTVVPEKSASWLYLTNPGADARFGRLEATMTLSGVESHVEATKLAQSDMILNRSLKREVSFEYVPSEGMPVPWETFEVGDHVKARFRSSWAMRRVLGVTVTKGDGISVRVTTGEYVKSRAARIASRSAAAGIGTVIGGTGNLIPGASGPVSAVPAAPEALRVTSNVGVWNADGSARSSVTVEWDDVIAAVDGSTIDATFYELWARDAAGVSSVVTGSAGLSTVVESWQSGVPRFLKVRARSRAGVWSAFSPEVAVTPQVPVSIIPKAPSAPVAGTNVASYLPDGRAVATVTFSWAAVTQSTDNLSLTVAAYEPMLEDGASWIPLAETSNLTATIAVASGATRRVRVRARTALGVWGDPSPILSVTGANPAASTVAPSAPVLTSGGGGAFVRWDGLLTSGAPGAGFQGVFAQYRVGTSGAFTRLSGPLSVASGEVGQVRAAVGSTVQVQLVPVDTLGRVGTASATASVTVAGVASGDLDSEVSAAITNAQSAANTALTAANGKNKIWHQTDAPDGTAHAVGDIWFDTDDGNKIYEWVSPGSWVANEFGSSAIANLAITNAKIADATIQSAKIAAIDAGKITAGTIAADRIGANTITAEKMVIGDFSNLVENPYFDLGLLAWKGSGGSLVADAFEGHPNSIRVQASGERFQTAIPVKAGDQFYFAMVHKTTGWPSGGAGGLRLQRSSDNAVTWSDLASSDLANAASWTPSVLTAIVPSGVTHIRVRFAFTATGATITMNGFELRRRTGGELIVDGAIVASKIGAGAVTAEKIQAGSISVDKVTPAFGQNLDISASGSILMVVGQQADLSQQSADNAEGLANQQKYLRFDVAQGLVLGASDDPAQLRLRNTGAALTVNGVELSTWEAGQMSVPSLKAEKVILGNHQLEKSGARTVMRAL